MDMIKIASACASECVRQRDVGLDGVARLINAYCYALDAERDRLPSLFDIHAMASIIEPEKTRQGYRTVPVTFDDGGGSASPMTIDSAMTRMFESLGDKVDGTTDEFVKAFLHVHPFIDGNGRIAFLLYNWLKNTLDAPDPLPNYFDV